MNRKYSRQQRKKLQELAALAHERELARELDELHGRFVDWRSGDMDVFQLSEEIHRFHDSTARVIWKLYANKHNNGMLVARALHSNLLTEDEVGEELMERLEPMVEALRQTR